MARVGPNQDINDPTTIIDLAYQYQQKSNQFGNLLAISQSQNPSATGSPIVDVSIPFKMANGSTQLLYGSDISFNDGEYTYDTDIVYNANILTYVYLAERFREYWNLLNNVIDLVNDFNYLVESDVDPVGPTTVNLGGGVTRIWGSLGGTEFTEYLSTFSPTTSFTEPSWIGFGPTDYNQLTYPQLLSQLSLLELERNTSLNAEWETNYWYDKYTAVGGSVLSAAARFTLVETYAPPNERQYIQFYNNTLNNMEVSMTMDLTATFDVNFSASYSSWAEIDDLNVYPTPFGGFKYLLSSFISHTESKPAGGGTIILSSSRNVTIPPGKSAFIGVYAGAGTTFGPSAGVKTVDITLTLDSETLSHSASFT